MKKTKRLPPAQLRVLRIAARAKRANYHWWIPTYRHDSFIWRKLLKRGYVTNGVEQTQDGYWQWTFDLTPLGKRAITGL